MRDYQGTTAFVDSVSLHDAFGALVVGRKGAWHEWGGQNVVDVTWLLLFENVQVLPGPGHKGSAPIPGFEQRIARRLPNLVSLPHDESVAVANTNRWLHHPRKLFAAAWQKSLAEPAFPAWSTQLRELWWPVHSAANRGLFNLAYSGPLSTLLGVSEGELKRLHAESAKSDVIKEWSRGRGGDAAELAGSAYVAAILARGKYHEYLARAHGLQLFSHQFRGSLTREMDSTNVQSTKSEQLFVQMLVGSALLEPTADARVDRWIDNIVLARTAIAANAFSLPASFDDGDAMRCAADAALAVGLPGEARYQIEVVDWLLSLSIGKAFQLALGPWGELGGLAAKAWKVARRKSLGEDLAIASSTRKNFQRLANSVAGKLKRSM